MLFKLTMRHKSAPSYSTVSIGFPADEPELHTLMARIGVGITTEKLCLIDAVENEHHALRALTGTPYGYIAYWGRTPAVEELLLQKGSQSMVMGGMQL